MIVVRCSRFVVRAYMARTNFENLKVYQLAEQLADAVWAVCSDWEHFDRDTIGKQIVRSADSIGANIAEGTGRYGIPDNKRFAYIARGSLNETQHWLRRAYKRNLLNQPSVYALKAIIDELAPRLNAYIKSISVSNARSGATNDERRTTNDI